MSSINLKLKKRKRRAKDKKLCQQSRSPIRFCCDEKINSSWSILKLRVRLIVLAIIIIISFHVKCVINEWYSFSSRASVSTKMSKKIVHEMHLCWRSSYNKYIYRCAMKNICTLALTIDFLCKYYDVSHESSQRTHQYHRTILF